MTQSQGLAKLLQRKRGCTALEIIIAVGTACPHKRLADLKAEGWTITRKQVAGERHGRYYGQPPKA